MVRALHVAVAVSLIALLFIVAYAIASYGIAGPPGSTELRDLGKTVLLNMINRWGKFWWAASPEGVTSILWDYRGVDTLYETMVLYAAVVGALAILRLKVGLSREALEKWAPISPIVESVSKIVVWLTLIIAVAMAINGHLTPGGGFVGGSAFAVVPVLVIAATSVYYLTTLGLKDVRVLRLRTTALALLIAVVLAPLAFGGYVFQNQVKPGTSFSYPPYFLGNVPLGGSLFLLNIIEFLAVGAAFTLAFIGLAIREDVIKASKEGDDHGGA